MITTAIITVYIVSAFLMWRYIRIAHSKGGRWENIKTGLEDLFAVFTPFINSIFIISFIFNSPIKKIKTKKDYSKFFAINDNRSLFQRIQYFLSKGRKFSTDETTWR